MSLILTLLLTSTAHAKSLGCFGPDRLRRHRDQTYIVNSWGMVGTYLIGVDPRAVAVIDRAFAPDHDRIDKICLRGTVDFRRYFVWAAAAFDAEGRIL